MDFSQAPWLVIWEVTRACDLACVHCRASADPLRHPLELDTEEGFRLLEQVRQFGDPLMIFTGGDPLKRPDLFDLLEYSVKLGLRTTVSPSPTPLLTAQAIERFRACGVARSDQRGRTGCGEPRRLPAGARLVRSRHVRTGHGTPGRACPRRSTRP
jgi:MoaA/NifB/PqqE/SkfB family radical SAM enzyme